MRSPLVALPALVALAALAALATLACVPAMNTPLAEIPRLGHLDEVMATQATIADPLFKKSAQPSYTNADWAACADASGRLQATALKTKEFTMGTDFDALAARVGDRAKALGAAATAKDAAAATGALKDMKAACAECHSRFR